MVLSEFLLKWAMRFYPPLFFQRIWVVSISKGFTGVRVKINKSLINLNYNNSIFGGTIFAAADPFYPLLFHQRFSSQGYKVIAWSKSSQIQFLKPGSNDLFFTIQLTDEEIAEALNALSTVGRYIKSHPISITDKNGEVCVTVMNEVYVRNLSYIDKTNESDNE